MFDAPAPAAEVHLASARTRARFVEACRRIVDDSPDLALDPDALPQLAPLLEGARPASWNWYLPDPEAPLDQVVLQFAFACAPNGGYFAQEPDGTIRQWARQGSGAKALLAWIERLRAEGKMPGVDVVDPESARTLFARETAGLPYARQRAEIAAEFADPARLQALRELVRSARRGGDGFVFELAHADRAAEIMPASFGGDPFRKKAVLFFLMLHGHLLHRGVRARYDLPCPSDYQLPRIFAYVGAIKVGEKLRALLSDQRELLDPRRPEVSAMRAAAVVCVDLIARRTGLADSTIDSALFIPFRKDPGFLSDSLPPMKCDGMWF